METWPKLTRKGIFGSFADEKLTQYKNVIT